MSDALSDAWSTWQFVDVSVNKLVALQRLCDILGVPMGAVVAFGDGNNDAEMLGGVGLGVAMPNGKAAAKAAAAEVLPHTNDEDGVSRKLEALLQEGRFGTSEE